MKRHTNDNTNNAIGKQRRWLLLIAAIFTAIAVAVTCALCFDKIAPSTPVEDVQGGEVNTSTGYSNPASGSNYSTTVKSGDTITYTSVGNFSITLPKGSYTLAVYGAQGQSGSAAGGTGGSASGSYTISATSATLWVYVGGSTGTNGGGGGLYYGGGASHISTASGVISNSTTRSGMIIAAGGGGGAGMNTGGAGGAGGGANGANGTASSWAQPGTGATTTSAGTGGTGYSSEAAGGAGGAGQGGTSSTTNSRGGGGGGGWYGGGSGGNDINSGTCGAGGGGGGSGYTGGVTSPSTAQGGQSGNGQVIITVVNVNSAPTSKNATVTGRARGTSGSTTFYASTIAQDSDSGQTVHFTDGTSTNYDTFNTTANTGLYLNSACTVLATDYISWTWTSNTQCNITEFKRYPRNGTYSTLDGRLTLYCKIRDSYGSTTTRGYTAGIVFYLTFATNSSTNSSGSKATTVNGVSGTYILGNSTTNATPASNYVPAVGSIYNPNGTGRFTAILTTPVKINNSFNIKATDLIGGLCTYDQQIISLSDTSKIISTNTARKFKVNELDSGSGKLTAFTSAKGAIANPFSTITITCLAPDPNYQVLTVTLYVVEKTTAWGGSYPNSVVPGVGTVTLDIVFKMQNSRPYVGTASNIVNVAVGETRNLSLSSYFADADGAISSSTHSIIGVEVPANEFIQMDASKNILAQTGNNAGFYNIGSINGDTTFTTSGKGTTATGFNSGIAYNSTSPISGTNTREAFMRFTYANDVLTVVGLRSSFSQYASGRNTKPGHFYLLLHIQDKRDTADNGIWLPLAFIVGYSDTTQFDPIATTTATTTAPYNVTEQTAASVKPTAAGSANQSFYFAPMAVGYSGMHVIGKYKDDSGNLTQTGLQPLALDGDNFSTTNGLATRSNKLNEFLKLSSSVTAESIVRSMSDVGVTVNNGVAENKFISAQLINIYVEQSYFATGTFQGATGGRVIATAGTSDVSGYRYTGALPTETIGGVAYYIINGFKITLKAATMNRYFYSTVTVTDTANRTSAAIDIAVRVTNVAPTAETDPTKVVKFGNADTTDAYSLYENTGVPTFTFKVPLGNSIVITPYDFASDFNMTNMGFTKPSNGFTLNGLQGVYIPSTGTLSTSVAKNDNNVEFKGLFSAEYNTDAYRTAIGTTLAAANGTAVVKKVSNAAAGTAGNAATTANVSVKNDKLFFARTSDGASDAYTYAPAGYTDIKVNASDTAGFVSYNLGNKVQIGATTYDCDFIMINSLSRTTRDASITLTVRDRYGDSSDCNASFTVRIIIDVVNTAPEVKDEFRYQELAVTPITESGVVALSAVTFVSNGNGEATGLMRDIDNDVPEFMLSAGLLITNNKGLATLLGRHPQSFEAIENNKALFTDDGTENGRPLTEYITATLVSSYELYVTALNSTKAISGGVYVCFLVTDNNGGTSFGYIQIEVKNTAPVFNTSPETGFDKNDPLWAIKTTSTADISRDRYIVGSEYTYEMLKEYRGAIDEDIRLIATDDDALHGKLALSPRITRDNGYEYINLAIPGEPTMVISDAAYDKAVPNIGVSTGFTDNANAAILLYTRTPGENGAMVDVDALPSGFTAEILFFDGEKWLKRSEVLAELSGKAIADVSKYFDASGRFIFTDWAFRMHATQSFDSGARVGITLSVRDNAATGGDTAGKSTAFASDRRNGKITVSANITPTVYHSISTTGIRTKEEFTHNYNDYYAVEYGAADGTITSYVPTYDGDENSTYGAGVSDINYRIIANNNWLDPEGNLVLKSRAEGSADGTKAGTSAGAPFNVNTVGKLDGVYQYPSVITVPADYSNIYVPMSYFGLLQNLVTGADDQGNFEYHGEYVGYDINSSLAYSRGDINDFASALTLTDGNTVWTGTTLNDNPYIKISAFDVYSANGSTSSLQYFDNTASSAYYNNRLAITAVDANGQFLGYEKDVDNRASFIGDGKLMYLEEQATKLQEHNFGLVFKKTNMRTGADNITLTIKLAKSENGKNTVEDDDDDRQTVTVSIRVENNKIDIAADSGSLEKTGVKYDNDKGTYYLDLTMSSADSRSFALLRRDPETGAIEAHSEENESADVIPYYDDDYRAGGTYRDRAYFMADSFGKLSSWDAGAAAYQRVLDNKNDAFVNTASTDSAQNSMLHYWGAADFDALEEINSDYCANDGIYGSSNDGYSSYFNASLTDANRLLNITANRKTTINEVAINRLLDGKEITQETVKKLYAERGIVAEYADAGVKAVTPTRTYYPFKVLIFDSCGVGWSDASFVALELRITITNATPTLKKVGDEKFDDKGNVVEREYRFNLAVGNSVTINLYDIVSDTDMYVRRTGSNYALATGAYFEENATTIDLETGDYLDSPYAHDEYLLGTLTYNPTNAVRKDDGTYYRNGGGLSLMPTSDTVSDKDVIMWMETQAGLTEASTSVVPRTNNLSFTVNRRTTATVKEGGVNKSVAINEYRFTLRFYDSFGEYTDKFTFIITITNQAPVITATERHFTMYSGDDITLLTSYFNEFVGIDKSSSAEAIKNGGSDAYLNSETKNMFDNRTSNSDYGVTYGDGQNNATEKFWLFKDINSDLKSKVVYDATANREGNDKRHLGYLGLASDDTPWKLRMTSIEYYNGQGAKVWVDRANLQLAVDGEGGSANRNYPLAINVRAVSACVNEPVTITLIDGDGGVVTTTVFFTIISSPPVALDYEDSNDRVLIERAGLEGEVSDMGGYKSGTFRMFTTPYGTATYKVDGITEPKTARREYRIPMNSVAKDLDSAEETNSMTLYGNGNFSVNGNTLISDNSGVFHAPYFDISITDNGRAFNLVATGFNPYSTTGYEELSFYVADYGNSSFDNAIEIKINVYTLYSDMQNQTAAAKSGADFTKYIEGSEKITVKSYDDYYGMLVSEPSRYAYMELAGSTGNDGNKLSPIKDPDVTQVGKQTYTARLYAFIDRVQGDEWTALDTDTLAGMFERDAKTGTFYLKPSDENNKYMIGGRTFDGTSLPASGSAGDRYNAIRRYVDFEFSQDGTALSFVPNASTLNNHGILLYVEVLKNVGASRQYKREGAVLSAGSLFTLDVIDSAPQAVVDAGMVKGVNWVASGHKGESQSFTVFDSKNPFSALFTDADYGDQVTIKQPIDDDYKTILAKALEEDPELDWAASPGRPRAFDITVLPAAGNIPAKLTITINRRMDRMVNGKYVENVSFPIVLEGVDIVGKSVKTVIMLTIGNGKVSVLPDIKAKYDEFNVGYSFEEDETAEDVDKKYTINAQIKYSHDLVIDLADLVTDPDFTEVGDGDSFTFASSAKDIYPYTYLGDEKQTVYWYETHNGVINEDVMEELATVEPLGADKWHRTAIKISAIGTMRTLTAKTYLRILDRATDGSDVKQGVYITLIISVMNDAPFVKQGSEITNVSLIGADNGSPESMLFFIGDFVDDNNKTIDEETGAVTGGDVTGDALSMGSSTYLRIFSQQHGVASNIYSTKFETVDNRDIDTDMAIRSSSLFSLTIPTVIPDNLLNKRAADRAAMGLDRDKDDNSNVFNQWFIITPIAGYYGDGFIDITIVDGDSSVQTDTLSTTFRINVRVLYDQKTIEDSRTAFNPVTISSSKSRSVDIGLLMPEIDNKLKPVGQTEEQSIATHADSNGFSQAEYYSLSAVELQNSTDSSYVTIEQVGTSGVWTLTATKLITLEPIRVNVKYKLNADPTLEYKGYFMLNVIENLPPVVKYEQIDFTRYDRTGDLLRDLDDTNTIRLEAWQLFDDPDDPDGTAMRFVGVSSSVPSIVTATLSEDNRFLIINFAAKGKSEITVRVVDENDKPVELTFLAVNEDLPEGSLWLRIMSEFEANTLMWSLIVGGALLLIILLIIIIVVAVRKKREREELEALLVSEMEIEEQMLKLAGGAPSSGYESFGYLPPATAQVNNPNPATMLAAGESAAAPSSDVPELAPPPPDAGNVPPSGDGNL